jgi:5-methylcytosine-specific restriction endonuclease McrA
VSPSHKSSLLDLLDRPIAFHRIFVELTGSVLAAVMLSQAFYWSRRTKHPGGWFYKTQEEWEEETGLKRGEQEAARKRLRDTGFWAEERRGIPARMYFKLDLEVLAEQLLGYQHPTWTVEKVLDQDATYLQHLSKSAYMRGRKARKKQASLQVEYVDYTKVLQAKGMTCGICEQPITQSLGMHAGHLMFDHIIPLDQGGPHTVDNLQPAHGECHRRKVGKLDNPQRNHQSAYHQPTSLLPPNTPDGLPEAHRSAYQAPTITETTLEITTETTATPPITLTHEEATTKRPDPREWMMKGPVYGTHRVCGADHQPGTPCYLLQPTYAA